MLLIVDFVIEIQLIRTPHVSVLRCTIFIARGSRVKKVARSRVECGHSCYEVQYLLPSASEFIEIGFNIKRSCDYTMAKLI